MSRIQRSAASFLALVVASVGLALAGNAAAQPVIHFGGDVAFAHTGTVAYLAADRIDNASIAQGISTSLRMELWAFPTPFDGINQVGYEKTGHLLATYDLGPLAFGYYFWQVNSGPVPFAPPPPGTWYMSMLLTEYNGGTHNAFGFLPRDYRNFPAESFSKPTVTPLAAPHGIAPQVGLWWNPDESGTGYAIDFKNGTLVVTVYSYRADGQPQWYLAAGPLIGNAFAASLDKYASGQCIACGYSGRPTPSGNDGTIAIQFSSSTSATVTLPGGRVIPIVPQQF